MISSRLVYSEFVGICETLCKRVQEKDQRCLKGGFKVDNGGKLEKTKDKKKKVLV